MLIDEDDEAPPVPPAERRLSGELYLLYDRTERCGRHGSYWLSCHVWEGSNGYLHTSDIDHSH